MTKITFPSATGQDLPESLLRNGWVKTSAIDVADLGDHVRITPYNSRGVAATGCIALPRETSTLRQLIRDLRALTQQIEDQQAEREGLAGRSQWAEAATLNCSSEDIDIDADAIASVGSEGCYVEAWVYVRQEDAIPCTVGQPANLQQAQTELAEKPDYTLYVTRAAAIGGEYDGGKSFDVVTAASDEAHAQELAMAWGKRHVPIADDFEICTVAEPQRYLLKESAA